MSNNKKRDSKSHEKSSSSMAVSRRKSRLGALRSGNVIEFQGQPMMVRGAAIDDGLVRLSLSRAFKTPASDREVKVGRPAASSYEEWSFTTRPISSLLTVDRFRLVPRSESSDTPQPKRRKRANASDRVSS